MKNLFEVLENKGITVVEYTEDNVLCGYELNTYTNGRVNMIIFLDFRGEANPLNEEHFISKFNHYLNDFDIDETIDMYRESQLYKDNFTISQSVKDFKAWRKDMKRAVKKLNV